MRVKAYTFSEGCRLIESAASLLCECQRAEKYGAGLYKTSIMRHTSHYLSWRIFYYAIFDNELEQIIEGNEK
jgi:hypothetical protein